MKHIKIVRFFFFPGGLAALAAGQNYLDENKDRQRRCANDIQNIHIVRCFSTAFSLGELQLA